MTTTYTIERLSTPEDFTEDVKEFFRSEAPKISEMFDNILDYKNCSIFDLAARTIFLICRRNGEVRGYMICHLFKSPLDRKVKILYQLSFYVMPNSGRTAYHLFHKFIDIGKREANHIITMLTKHTNIKPTTLEGLGFEEAEIMYRMRVK